MSQRGDWQRVVVLVAGAWDSAVHMVWSRKQRARGPPERGQESARRIQDPLRPRKAGTTKV